MAYVYRHIRLDKNEPFYIGVGEDNLEAGGKYSRARHTIQRNRYWKNIVAKTGYEIEILMDGLTWEKALEKECEFISLYGRKDLGKGPLCNLTDGGDGIKGIVYTPEQLDKIRKKVFQYTLDGQLIKIWDYARQVKEIGYNHANVVRCCNKIYKSAYGYRWCYIGEELGPYTPPPPKKFPKINRERFQKKIVQKTLMGEPIKIWPSLVNIEKEIGFLASNISKGCSKGGIIYGYKWEYFDEKKEYKLIDVLYNQKQSSKKRIVQKLKDGRVIKIWEGVAEILKNTKFKSSTIHSCCGKYKKSAYGYFWEYFDYLVDYKIDNLGVDCTKKNDTTKIKAK